MTRREAPWVAWRHHFATLNWTLLDQALSSGTNFVLALIVVRSVPNADFGAFSVAALLYVLGVGFTRAITTEPLTIRHGRDDAAIRNAARRCCGAALGIGGVLGLACALAAPFVSGHLRVVLLIVGVTFPLLLVQDSVRVVFFAMQQPRRAAANDAVWALLELGMIIAVRSVGSGVTSYVGAWLFSGAIAGLYGLLQLRLLPAFLAGPSWIREHRLLGLPLFWNFVLMSAPPYLLFAATPLVTGLGVLGTARAAYIPFSPFGLLIQSSWMLLLPAAARRSERYVKRLAIASSLALGSLAFLWTVTIVFAIPNGLGLRLIGSSWSITRGTRAVFGVALVAQALGIGPLIALRALERPGALVRVRMITAPLILATGLLAAARWGAIGVAVGIALGDVSATLLSWKVQRHVLVVRKTAAESDIVREEPPANAFKLTELAADGV